MAWPLRIFPLSATLLFTSRSSRKSKSEDSSHYHERSNALLPGWTRKARHIFKLERISHLRRILEGVFSGLMLVLLAAVPSQAQMSILPCSAVRRATLLFNCFAWRKTRQYFALGGMLR